MFVLNNRKELSDEEFLALISLATNQATVAGYNEGYNKNKTRKQASPSIKHFSDDDSGNGFGSDDFDDY